MPKTTTRSSSKRSFSLVALLCIPLAAILLGLAYYFKENTTILGTTVEAGNCRVALTFDDGPNLKQTSTILKILKQHEVPATFFMLGKEVRDLKAAKDRGSAEANYIVDQMNAENHDLGNHSWRHPNFNKKSTSEIMDSEVLPTSKIIRETFGREATFFRPPYGNSSADITELILQQTKMPTILWHVDTEDWKRGSKSEENILASVKKGVKKIANASKDSRKEAVILMHDGGGDRSKTIKQLPEIIETTKKAGCTLVPMSQITDRPTLHN